MLTSTAVKTKAAELGFDLSGVSPAERHPRLARLADWIAEGRAGEMTYLAKSLGERLDPRRVLPTARTVISLASLYAVGLALLENAWLGRVLGNRALVYIGKISYGIYLYHVYAPRFASLALSQVDKRSLPVQVALYSAITLAVASASWFLFEKPINGLKSRFRY